MLKRFHWLESVVLYLLLVTSSALRSLVPSKGCSLFIVYLLLSNIIKFIDNHVLYLMIVIGIFYSSLCCLSDKWLLAAWQQAWDACIRRTKLSHLAYSLGKKLLHLFFSLKEVKLSLELNLLMKIWIMFAYSHCYVEIIIVYYMHVLCVLSCTTTSNLRTIKQIPF